MRLLVAAVVVDMGVFVVADAALARGDVDRRAQHGLFVLELLAHLLTATALVGVAREFVQRKRQHFHDEQVLAATASASPDWLWETDARRRFTFSSAGVEQLLGLSPDEVVGQQLGALLAPGEDPARLERHLETYGRTRRSWQQFDAAWRHKDGHAVVLRGSGSPIYDESGRLTGYRGSRRLVADTVDVGELVAASRRRVSEMLAARALRVALQPIVRVADGRLVGAEALARFDDGRGPDAWFREAREAGLVVELERLAFLTALDQLERLPSDVYLSVNASPDLLLDAGFRDTLAGRGEDLSRLVIEVTEHERISDYHRLLEALCPLRSRGVRIAVDDAGAGYASMAHVLELRPDIVKLDRDLLQHLDIDSARRSLVTALVLLALDLGATVTGEGVETPAQLAALDLLAVDHAQGYLLGRPEPDPEAWRDWTSRVWTSASQACAGRGEEAVERMTGIEPA